MAYVPPMTDDEFKEYLRKNWQRNYGDESPLARAERERDALRVALDESCKMTSLLLDRLTGLEWKDGQCAWEDEPVQKIEDRLAELRKMVKP